MMGALRLCGSVIEPPTLLCLAVLAGAIAALMGRHSVALALQLVAAALVVFFGILPGAVWIALPLEAWYPPKPTLPTEIAGIIALGGTERLAQSEAWGQPILSDPSPIAALVDLGHRYPAAKLVFTGGQAMTHPGGPTEAQVVRDFLSEMGISSANIVYEEKARDTIENAIFSRELIHPSSDRPWVLITQAISLPRAVAVFRHAGWRVIPFPAGYISDRNPSLATRIHLQTGLAMAAVAVHEWGGLIAYRLMGYTDELLPK